MLELKRFDLENYAQGRFFGRFFYTDLHQFEGVESFLK